MADTCSANTLTGDRCKRVPIQDGLCSIHSGKQRVGPRGKLTQELIDQLCELLGDGVLIKHAADALGVHHATILRWREVGEADLEAGKEDTLHAQLVLRSSRAKAEGIIFHVKNLKKHAPNDWRSSSFFLERTDPDSYSRRDKTELTHAGRVENVVIPDDRERAAEVAKILAEAGALDVPDAP